jgi:hypothetical protein
MYVPRVCGKTRTICPFRPFRPLCPLCPNCAPERGERVRARTRKERKNPKERAERERKNPRAEAPNPQHKQNQHKPRAKPQALEAPSPRRSRPNSRNFAARLKISHSSLHDQPATRKKNKKNLVALLENALEICLTGFLEANCLDTRSPRKGSNKWKP